MTWTDNWSAFLMRLREETDENRRAQAALSAQDLARQGRAKQAGDLFYALGESASGAAGGGAARAVTAAKENASRA